MARALGSLWAMLAEALDWAIGWDRLPLPLTLAVLAGIRARMRQRNLFSTGLPTNAPLPPLPPEDDVLRGRTADGRYNDRQQPLMGAANTRFGRNVPLDVTFPEAMPAILSPSPRTISRELLARQTFLPAHTLNLLAAAWLQFMVHDWFSHGKNARTEPWQIPLDPDDPWPQRPMVIQRTRHDPHASGSMHRPPTFANVVTHWWDASQIYGSDLHSQRRFRSGRDGKLTIGADGLLPLDPRTGTDLTGVQGNWWVGLSLLHGLFSLEHNAICDRLRSEYPRLSDEELFQTARLITAALLAKIHTVEWTPAILGHPATRIAARANWWGLEGERLHRFFGRVVDNEVLSGIVGGRTDHFGVPYAMTEEFVAVYRMHQLLPDDYTFRAAGDDRVLAERTFPLLADRHAREFLTEVLPLDALYTFGTTSPGAITLHNFPNSLRQRTTPDGKLIDLAAIDILRSRERGVPRYNAFRRLVHRKPVTSFEELTDNPVWADELRRVYDGDLERVDLSVGLYAEPLPAGFGFSDTAFRIFTLMASRRLNSDRFFTTDFHPRAYSPVGMQWIADNTMATVLERHHPALAPLLGQVANTFAPWPRTRTC